MPRRKESGRLRIRDTESDAALTQSSGASRACGTFPDECCFQVIYFVSNISFVAAADEPQEPVWKAFA
jgi:hypothetical protein